MAIKTKIDKTTVFTIGFTKKTAQEFFGLLKRSEVKKVIDIRLKPGSQLAGFAKGDDLRFFLDAILGITYVHMPELAPTKELLDGYRKGRISWATYERDFRQILFERKAEDLVDREKLAKTCFLCSEADPRYCHRRLVAEYLHEKFGSLKIVHL